eukprot:888001_1
MPTFSRGRRRSRQRQRSRSRMAIVIDNGSGYIKAGFSGDVEPIATFPTVVGIGEKDAYVGDEAQFQARMGMLTLNYPIEDGVVKNWDDMEKVWYHLFYDVLKASPNEHPILLTEKPGNPKANREILTQIMFEKFNVPAVYLAYDAELALYASGRTTGIVLSSGYSVTQAVPIYEGYVISDAVLQLDVGGADITEYLRKLMIMKSQRGRPLTSDEARVIKERSNYVALDFDSELELSKQSSDSRVRYNRHRTIRIGSERFQAPEILFTPSMAGIEGDGIDRMLVKSIEKCDESIRNDLYQNIILAGGSTMFPGIEERLYRGMPEGIQVKIVGPPAPERQNSTWIGGRVLSSLSTFEESWITKEEYDEYGPTIVHKGKSFGLADKLNFIDEFDVGDSNGLLNDYFVLDLSQPSSVCGAVVALALFICILLMFIRNIAKCCRMVTKNYNQYEVVSIVSSSEAEDA